MCLTSYLVISLNFESTTVHVYVCVGVRKCVGAQKHRRWTSIVMLPHDVETEIHFDEWREITSASCIQHYSIHVIGWHTFVCIHLFLGLAYPLCARLVGTQTFLGCIEIDGGGDDGAVTDLFEAIFSSHFVLLRGLNIHVRV